MRRLLVMAALIPCMGFAQEAGYTIHVDFNTRELTQCVSVPIGTLSNVRFVGDLDVSALIGLRSQANVGLALTKRWAVADNASLSIGPSVRIFDGEGDRVGYRFGFAATIGWRL